MTVLTLAELQALMADPSPARQAEATTVIADAWRQGTLDPRARAEAEALFRVVARQAAQTVRVALSRSVKEAGELPYDVALALAQDVDDVALPMLEASTVLTDDDLVALVTQASAARLSAMARRPRISEPLADALVDHGDAGVVAALVANPGAALGPATLDKVVARHGGDDRVAAPLARRPGLPPAVTERLVHAMSEALRAHLSQNADLAPELADDLMLQAREQAILGLVGSDQELDALVDSLHARGRLTPTLVLRALLTGDTLFFETALARRAGIAAGNASRLLQDPVGLAKLYQAAAMPAGQLPLVRVALAAAADAELGETPGARARYRAVVVERILTGFGDRVDTESFDYMITKLGQSNLQPGASAA